MGNRSSGAGLRGMRRTYVRLPGFYVRGQICIPKAHAHALWMLPWLERLLQGEQLSDVMNAPPWPVPPDALVARQLVRELIDQRWAVPDWTTGALAVAPELAESFGRDGRTGLARMLFEAEVLSGEWWMDGLGGMLLARQTAMQFDWDLQKPADVVLSEPESPQTLLDASEPDLSDLIIKLGGVARLRDARDQAFLATPLLAAERKDILFPLFGDDVRILPDELSELEPVLERHAPELFGTRRAVRPRVVRLPRSPVEMLAVEIERLPLDPVALGPLEPVQARVERISALARELEAELVTWLSGSQVRPVAGPTQRHFDALAEMCAALSPGSGRSAWVLLASAFLNPDHLAVEGGLVTALEKAPADARFLVVYGRASDDLPEQQQRDMTDWLDTLRAHAPRLAARVVLVAGKRRSHEKVVLTSAGDWMVGSWNPASSRPHGATFECSLGGRDHAFAMRLLDRIRENVEGPDGTAAADALARALGDAPGDDAGRKAEALARVQVLQRALLLVTGSLPGPDGGRAEAWPAAIQALRAAFQPFVVTARLDLVDEHQTRDALLGLIRSARRDVLLASDRLADSALDGATLRDLRGHGRSRRLVRVVWGREWAGRRSADPATREQIRRARQTVQDAREQLGPMLRTSVRPMENHAKVLLVDSLRGLVTSENILSYGGEKGRHESRELGIVFWSPVVARHLLGRFVLQWPGVLGSSGVPIPEPPLAWLVAGHEAWHALAPIAAELDFEWQHPTYLGAVVHDELDRADPEDDQAAARRDELVAIGHRLGPQPFARLLEEAERLGLAHPTGAKQWCPYDSTAPAPAEGLLEAAERLMASVHPRSVAVVAGVTGGTPSPAESVPVHPLIARVRADMVRIPAGRFLMGDDRVHDERPQHAVVISRPFLLGRTPVTQGLWEEVMGGLPHLRDVERHPEFPIIQVSHADICRFLERLNALPGGGNFELPTEAQWEYACRAGSGAAYAFGDDPGDGDRPGRLERHAWTKRNSRACMQRVGALEPNAWGLHDMHGLVYETMRDGFRRYTRAQVIDPVGPLDGARIVARGGFWGRFPLDRRGNPANEHFRCAARQVHEKSHRVSFRIAFHIDAED